LGALGVINITMNFAIIAMPLPFMYKMHMPYHRKVVACVALVVGLVAVACEMTAVATFIQSQTPSNMATGLVSGIFADEDAENVSSIMFWGIMEVGFISIAICMPTIAPFAARHIPQACLTSPRGRRPRGRMPYGMKGTWDSESCYSLEGTASLNPATKSGLHLVQSRVSTPVDSYSSRPVTPARGKILVENQITQTIEIV
jgi:hypothetical protein